MGKSYRAPYVYMTKGVRESHKSDKQVASRCFRRMANRDLRACLDWDELLTPHRFEARHNNVYSWAGDGHAQYEGERWRDLDNPYYCNSHCSWTEDEIHERHAERLARYQKWAGKIRRK